MNKSTQPTGRILGAWTAPLTQSLQELEDAGHGKGNQDQQRKATEGKEGVCAGRQASRIVCYERRNKDA